MKLNLQFFGGNGSGGESLGNGGGKNVNIINQEDVWSYRHNKNNEQFVTEINNGIIAVQNEFPSVMRSVESVNASEFGGSDKNSILGVYTTDASGKHTVDINRNFTNVNKMNAVYDVDVKAGYHPSRGNKTGTEAVTIHEMGHAVTGDIARKMGLSGTSAVDKASQTIVENAYKATKGKGGTKAWAGAISGYAKTSFAECVAEAVADYGCNGSKANDRSKAIIKEMKKYY